MSVHLRNLFIDAPGPLPNPTRARNLIVATPADLERELQRQDRIKAIGVPQAGRGSLQTWEETIGIGIADGTAIANTVTETILIPDFTFGIGYMYPGRTVRYKLFGRISTTATPTMTFRARWGGVAGVVLVASAAVTTPSGAANLSWYIELVIICRSIGVAGSMMATGTSYIGSQTTENLMPASAPAVASVDTTVAKALSITAQWGTANAANTLQVHNAVLEALN